MTLFELAAILGSLICAIVLGSILASKGIAMLILGVLGGLIGGWFLGPLLVLCVFLVGIALQEGPRAAINILLRRNL